MWETMEFNLFKAYKFASISNECHRIGVIDSLVWKTVSNYNSNDPLEQCLLYDSFTKDENPEVAIYTSATYSSIGGIFDD